MGLEATFSDHSTNKVSTVTQKPVCIISWNSRGSSEQKLQFMNHLVSPQVIGDNIPILCNQENFILKANVYRIFQSVPGFYFFINPAIKDSHDRGRPRNGMFIGIPEYIKSFVKDVSPNHWRVQAVIIENHQSRTLLINTYFPFDKREGRNDEADNDDLIETISIINNVI